MNVATGAATELDADVGGRVGVDSVNTEVRVKLSVVELEDSAAGEEADSEVAALVGSDPGTGTTERLTVASHSSRDLPLGQQPPLVQ